MNDRHGASDDTQEQFEAQPDIGERALNIIEDLYRITVAALKSGELEPERIEQLLEAITEGFRTGVLQKHPDIETAFKKAANGFDEAMEFAAIASKTLIREARSKAEELTGREMKKSLHHLNNLENQFLENLAALAASGSDAAREIYSHLAEQSQRSAPVVGKYCTRAMTELDTLVMQFGDRSRDTGREIAKLTKTNILPTARGWLLGLAGKAAIRPDPLKSLATRSTES
ncbi:MAG: DUF6781 family protein [Methylococcales bacterium]